MFRKQFDAWISRNFKGLSALKKIGSIGKKVLGPLGTIAGVTISELIGDNADKFSGTQKLARIGIQSATSLAGGALGGLIGSAIGIILLYFAVKTGF